MTTDALLARFDRHRKTAAGWEARCPAHEDRRPSLAVSETEDRVLIHCRAGCTTEAVCSALGLTLADLFHDRGAGPSRRGVHAPRSLTPRGWLSAAELGLWRGAITREYRALAVLDAARGCDTSGWSDEDFARAMVAVCRANDDLRVAASLHDLAARWREQIRAWDTRGRKAA